MTSTIALVLDRNFGDRVLALAKEMPVWIISSEANNPAVTQTRRLLNDTANITTLLARREEALNDVCLRGLYEIDEHHGINSSGEPYDHVLVYGCAPDLVTPQIMRELGLAGISEFSFGFSANKQNGTATRER